MRSIIPVFVSHQGCPHTCVFCNQHTITGEKSWEPSAEETIAKALFHAKLPSEIAFYGGSFTAIAPEKRISLLKTAKKYVDLGLVSSIRVSTRPDCISEEVLDELFAFGVRTIELGAQSMCPDVLHLARRGHSAQDVERAAMQIRGRGFSLGLQMMTGLPGDTAQKARFTAREFVRLRADFVRIYPLVVIQGSALESLYRSGAFEPPDLEEAIDGVARILDVFDEARISVIRIGLNPNEELSHGAAVAGAYHPAFGELARSRQFFLHLCRRLDQETGLSGKRLSIFVSPRFVSKAVGQKRANLTALSRRYGFSRVAVRADDTIPGGDFVLDIENSASGRPFDPKNTLT